jgi:threonine/homoserine/homoserine lactone efflux protein
MTIGIAEVLPFAVGVAISPVPIIAVILMLFSSRAKVNGPMFLIGWAVALAVVSGVTFLAGDAASETTTADAVSWSQVLFGVLFVLLAVRTWGKRARDGVQPEQPTWMAGIDSFSPVKAVSLALLLAGVNPKNLLLAAGAGVAVAGLGLPTTEAVVSLVVFVVIASLTIAVPVAYYLAGGDAARTRLDAVKEWLAVHNDAVMTVLFLVLGVNLISKGIPPLM